MHAPTLERTLITVPIRDLHAHPANTRGTMKDGDVASLVESIKARGILTPLIVRPEPLARPGYQILAGHRRKLAAGLAGLERVPCMEVSLGDEEAAAVVLLENLDRQDPDLFRQADLVAKLLALKNGAVHEVATVLGKSPRWVARLRAIAGLEPGVRKAMQSEKCDWTVQMVEHFAGLAHDVQKARWETVRLCRDMSSLKHVMEEDFHLLKDAPFDIAREDLVPKAGSCLACPKTSARAPGLFDTEELDPADPKQVAKATCRDPGCWTGKCLALAKADVQAVAQKTGAAPVILTDWSSREKAKQLGQVDDGYGFEKAKKGDKGAVPAVRFRDGQVGPVQWVKPVKGSASRGKPKAGKREKAKPPTEAQRLERFLQRRAAWMVDHVQELVREAKRPPYKLVKGLVAAFGCGLIGAWDESSLKAGELGVFLESVLADDVRWADAVWPHAQHHAVNRLARTTLDQAPKQLEDAVAVCALLHETPSDEASDYLSVAAEKAMPTPLSLQGPLAEARAHFEQASPAKGGGRRGRRAAGKAAAAADDSAE